MAARFDEAIAMLKTLHQVKQDGDSIIVETNIIGLSPDSLALTIMHEGSVEAFKTLAPQGEGVDTNPTQKVIQIAPSPREGRG